MQPNAFHGYTKNSGYTFSQIDNFTRQYCLQERAKQMHNRFAAPFQMHQNLDLWTVSPFNSSFNGNNYLESKEGGCFASGSPDFPSIVASEPPSIDRFPSSVAPPHKSTTPLQAEMKKRADWRLNKSNFSGFSKYMSSEKICEDVMSIYDALIESSEIGIRDKFFHVETRKSARIRKKNKRYVVSDDSGSESQNAEPKRIRSDGSVTSDELSSETQTKNDFSKKRATRFRTKKDANFDPPRDLNASTSIEKEKAENEEKRKRMKPERENFSSEGSLESSEEDETFVVVDKANGDEDYKESTSRQNKNEPLSETDELSPFWRDRPCCFEIPAKQTAKMFVYISTSNKYIPKKGAVVLINKKEFKRRNINERMKKYYRSLALVCKIPKYPGTWYTVKLMDGEMVKLRSGCFVPYNFQMEKSDSEPRENESGGRKRRHVLKKIKPGSEEAKYGREKEDHRETEHSD